MSLQMRISRFQPVLLLLAIHFQREQSIMSMIFELPLRQSLFLRSNIVRQEIGNSNLNPQELRKQLKRNPPFLCEHPKSLMNENVVSFTVFWRSKINK